MNLHRGLQRSARLLPLALALAGIAAVMAAALCAADPADTSVPPTEDWVFDAGGQTTISSVSWDVGYNITVTNGSSLWLEGCAWTMSPAAAGTGPQRAGG